ncbi:fumarylacetoacetase [Janibacter anophelis]|uniref:fumarylacetoacetase n=1 Tax=Janibacter anophelis TaxID=319054 RepID=UPI000DEEF008|nr:fumarylacetoacetase [Janibacter anophelis]
MTTAAQRFSTEGFGPDNLPYASFSPAGGDPRLGVRLGDLAISLRDLVAAVTAADGPRLPEEAGTAASAANLDALLAAGHTVWQPLRAWLQEVVTTEGLDGLVESVATPVADVTLHMPFTVADYVDYYASEQHASNIGRMFRPDQAPLLPNWKHLPVGYHGRAGTVIPSGTDVPRPKGLRPEEGGTPSFGPSRRLDIEAELGFVVGGSAPEGEVSVARAGSEHLFGVVLFNDWSARDIQGYEYVPLGPYLGKSFASSISLWVVPWEALAAARVTPPARDHQLAEYLDDSQDPWALDITMEVELDGEVVSHPPVKELYWTAPQMVAHMTVNGASLRPGDFFGSGTVSGDERQQRGSFMELSWGGKEPLVLADGREMRFLEDGQTVTLRGTAPGPDGSVIDLGECVGTIRPAR